MKRFILQVVVNHVDLLAMFPTILLRVNNISNYDRTLLPFLSTSKSFRNSFGKPTYFTTFVL